MRILVVEDNVDLVGTLEHLMSEAGFVVDVLYDKKTADMVDLELGIYDAVLLDILLPDGNGWDLLRRFKVEQPSLPVLVMTGLGHLDDVMKGFELGVDDYLVKPFEACELVARLRVLLRSSEIGSECEKVGDLAIYPMEHRVVYNGRTVDLTTLEFRLLYHLVRHKGVSQTTRDLLGAVWDSNALASANKVMTTVSRMRKKLGEGKTMIRTTKKGYLLN